MAWPQIFRPDNMTLGNEAYVLGLILVLALFKIGSKIYFRFFTVRVPSFIADPEISLIN